MQFSRLTVCLIDIIVVGGLIARVLMISQLLSNRWDYMLKHQRKPLKAHNQQ